MIAINYRKSEGLAEARLLKVILTQLFPQQIAILDHFSEDHTEHRIDSKANELNKDELLIIIIGPRWLTASDSEGERLIDSKNDSVRIEIENAILRDTEIIPVLIQGATKPTVNILPDSIKAIHSYQFHELPNNDWTQALEGIVQKIEARINTSIKLSSASIPDYSKLIAGTLSPKEIAQMMEKIPLWKLQSIIAERNQKKEGTELHRRYKFNSFQNAIRFMSEAAAYIDKINHHPTWINSWVNLDVHLTTWDEDTQVTALDVDLAFYLEDLYNRSYKSNEIFEE